MGFVVVDGVGSPARRFYSPALAWRQRRRALLCCRELLALYRRLSLDDPALTSRALYRRVVAAHLGDDDRVAEVVLQRAEESYAAWPAVRALTFRDVVHCVAVMACWRRYGADRPIESDLRRLVDAAIPSPL